MTDGMKFQVLVTVEMTGEQMYEWARKRRIEASEGVILADMWGCDAAEVLNGPYGQIVGVDVSEACKRGIELLNQED